ncbi:MAG: hypothetical protein MZV63_69150 [Marinilabiliales bacterium]|nr:hypothetical protein [Marinilabiliales bacterium]
MRRILKRSGAKLRQASADNDYITVRERFTDNGKALLFVANYYNEERRSRVVYTHPETGEACSSASVRREDHAACIVQCADPRVP